MVTEVTPQTPLNVILIKLPIRHHRRDRGAMTSHCLDLYGNYISNKSIREEA